MKKTLIVLGMMLISLQLPFCPYQFLSNKWVNRLELGRKFLVPIVLEAYGVSSEKPNQKPQKMEPKGFVSVQVNYNLPESECPEAKRIAAAH